MALLTGVLGKVGALDKVRHTYFDSFAIRGEHAAPQRLYLFQRPVGQLALTECRRCGAAIEGAMQRTSIETNMEMAGQLPWPRIFVVQGISIEFKFPLLQDIRELFANNYRLELQVLRDVVFTCNILTTIPEPWSWSPPEPITIQPGEYFAPQLVTDSDPPPVFPCHIHGYVRLCGDLYHEVRES